MGITWSPDSKWLAYAKTFDNNLRRITVWSVEDGSTHFLTDPMADALSPSWSHDGKHIYLLASTDVALGAGWANTSAMGADPQYGVYAILLTADAESPFAPESDEEESDEEESDEEEPESKESDKEESDESNEESDPESDKDTTDEGSETEGSGDDDQDTSQDEEGAGSDESDPGEQEDESADEPSEADADKDAGKKEAESSADDAKAKKSGKKDETPVVKIDLQGIERRIITIPMPVSEYRNDARWTERHRVCC